MNKSLIAVSIAAALATSMANAAPKVYGKLNVSFENIKDDTKQDGRWEMISNASRFGLKGEDEVTATVSAIYGIEWEVSTDGNGTDLGQRNRFVGLKHQSAGTVKFGRVDTLTKLAQGEIDLFNDLNADMGKVIAGENRVNNVLTYESPKIADAIQLNLQVIPGEETQDKTATGANCAGAKANQCDDNGIADAISASLIYNNEEAGLYAALALDKGVASTLNAAGAFNGAFSNYVSEAGGTVAAAKTDIIRLVGSYNLKDQGLTLNALIQKAERSDAITSIDYTPAGGAKFTVTDITPEEQSYLLGVAWKVPGVEGLTAKLQYVTAETDFGDAAIDKVTLKQTSVGADYNLASKTKVFGYVSTRDYKNDNNTDTGNGKSDSYKSSFLAFGMEHKF
jgi:predicted porin